MLKILTKHIECGKYSFNVAVDRDISVKAMEEYPELSAYLFEMAKEEGGKSKNLNKKVDEIDFLVDNLKNKKMGEFLKREEDLADCVKFAFPLMLEKAGETLNADELLAYMEENGVLDEFNSGMYELILMGFTQREVAKKKVGFSMK